MLDFLFSAFSNFTWQMPVMWAIGGLLIYLAIKKEMEPTLLLPMGFGVILVNLPFATSLGVASEEGVLSVLFNSGISNELFPLLLFIGIGAMIDFGPLLSNPKLMLFGAAAQFGIFFTLSLAVFFGKLFPSLGITLQDAASIGIIGAADGPTSIVIAMKYQTKFLGAIVVAAYSYMALVPIIQPPIVKLATTKKERRIKMDYHQANITKLTKILFPIIITIITGLFAPESVALIGCLMFGNLIRECGVLDSLSDTAQNVLANLITIFLGITVAVRMNYEEFLQPVVLLILCLGLVAFVFDTFAGVMFAKLINLFSKKKINPMIGACGISAFPMSSRVIHKMAMKEDPTNIILMHATGVNVSGQIASVIAGGIILSLIKVI